MGELTESVKLLHEHRPPVCLLIASHGQLVERLKIHSPLEKESKRWMREEAEGGEDEVRGKDAIMEDP